MKKYRYHTVAIHGSYPQLAERLNELGNAGWRLVSIKYRDVRPWEPFECFAILEREYSDE